MSSAVEFAKLEETQDYNNKQYQIQQAELAINREQLYNEYQSQILNYKNSILSAKSQKDSYQEAMDMTENVYLPQTNADISSYESLLSRWDANFTAEMTAAKQQGQQQYEALLGNFANMGVGNAEAGREGATANLLEQKQKQNVIDYVGSDMTLDQNGGLFGMAITQQALDLYADKASYQTQLGILNQAKTMYENNLNIYQENMAEMDEAIAGYENNISEFESYINKLQTEWGMSNLDGVNSTNSTIDYSKYDSGLYTTSNGHKVIYDHGTMYYAAYDSGSGRWVPTAKVQSSDDIGELTSLSEKYYYYTQYITYKQNQEKLQESSTASWKNLQNGVYQTSDGQNVIIHNGKIYSAAGSKSMGESDGISWLIGDILSNNQISSYTSDNLTFVKGNYKDKSGTSYSSDNNSNTKAIEQEAAEKAEQERLAKEAAAKAEQERLAREEAARQEQERLAREEEARQEQERLAREEAARQEQEKQQQQQQSGSSSSGSTTYTPDGTGATITGPQWMSRSKTTIPVGVYKTGSGQYVIINGNIMYKATQNADGSFKIGEQMNDMSSSLLAATGLKHYATSWTR